MLIKTGTSTDIFAPGNILARYYENEDPHLVVVVRDFSSNPHVHQPSGRFFYGRVVPHNMYNTHPTFQIYKCYGFQKDYSYPIDKFSTFEFVKWKFLCKNTPFAFMETHAD